MLHYTKRIFFWPFIILTSLMLTACQISAQNEEKRAYFEPYIISVADIGDELLDAAIYENIAYLVNNENILSYDLTSGEISVIADITGNTAICVDKEYIYTYNKEQNAVLQYNRTDKLKKTYQCAFEPIDAYSMRVFNDTVIIAAKYMNKINYPESNIYRLNLANGESSVISDGYRGQDSYSLVLGFDFIDKNSIIIMSLTNTNFMNPIVRCYEYDLKKEKLLNNYFIPYSSSYSFDPNKKCIYYNSSSTVVFEGENFEENLRINIHEYYPETSASVMISSIKYTALNPINKNNSSFITDKMFLSDDSIILWSNNNKSFLVACQASDEEALKVLLTHNAYVATKFSIITDQFEYIYGYPVHIIEYPEDVFFDKLRTKLLAGDGDFDIYLVNEPYKDNLLNAILKQDIYEPLDKYEGIVANFSQMHSGIRSIMSYNGELFAVPYAFDIRFCTAKYDLKRYGHEGLDINWTYDDIWKLCDGIINSGDSNITVFTFPTYFVQFIDDFVQDAVSNNYLDKDSLIEMLHNIKKYNDAGVLFDHNYSVQNKNEKKHLIEVSSFFIITDYSGITEYSDYVILTFPQYNNKNYINLNGAAFINKFSKNKDMASKFLELMTSDKNIYNTQIYQRALLASDVEKYDKYSQWPETLRSFLSYLPSLYNNSGLYTIDYSELNDYIINNVISDFFDGDISPESAADMIYDQVNYLYFE